MAHSSRYRWDTPAPAPVSGRDFRPPTTTAWDLRWWILSAVGVSIVVHLGLFFWMNGYRWPEPGRRTSEIRPAVFDTEMEQITIPEQVLQNPGDEPPDLTREVNREPVVQELPDISQIAEELRDKAVLLTPTIKEMAANVTLSKPAPGKAGDLVDDVSRTKSSLIDTSESLLSKSTVLKPQFTKPADDQVLVDANALDSGSASLKDNVIKSMKKGTGGNNGLDGFKNLDDLVNYQGPIKGDFKAMLRTDLLFDFGSAKLRDNAKVSLMNLGIIIQTNSKAQFRLVGHTDTIGDDASNQKLSEARAQAVKDWLVNSLKLDGTHILVEGRGKKEPLPGVDPRGNADAQQLNRRVEIHKTGG
ncbi:MAG TPA: OmpA family protein [Verrucomicrobiales bacterium]|nr:OmpA family protein [Verrucomicrobiales bacterium]